MPPKRKSSVPSSASGASKRARTPSLADDSESITETLVQQSPSSEVPDDTPIAPEEIRKFRATLEKMGYKQPLAEEPLDSEQILANMVRALTHTLFINSAHPTSILHY